MERGPTGTKNPVSFVDEPCFAFVPHALPPKPPLQWDGSLHRMVQRAGVALGRLSGVTGLLPDPQLFLYSYVRKEAVLSSQIEGTQSSLSELLLFENDAATGAPLDDVTEVSNYVAAMEHGTKRLAEGFPLSLRLIKEVHGVLLAKGRGSEKQPGEFRASQNWIGGSRPGNALFVPPPPDQVLACMGSLELFLHNHDVPSLVRAGLAHAQFETIHPFLDGNGRTGRLLVTLLLCHDGVLPQPLLYLSLFLKNTAALTTNSSRASAPTALGKSGSIFSSKVSKKPPTKPPTPPAACSKFSSKTARASTVSAVKAPRRSSSMMSCKNNP